MSTEEELIAEQMGDDDGDGEPDEGGGDLVERVEDYEGADVRPDQPAPTQAEIEARMAKLDKEAERHAKRVAEIMGDDFADLIPNPTDWTPGFIVSPELAPMPAEVLAAFDAIVGRGARADYLPATDAQACETCNALGRVLTGSKVDGQETKPCSTCSGSGWTHKSAPLAPVQQYDFSQHAGTQPPAPPNTVQVADRYGRPFGHPHYGMEPASVGA